MVVRGNIVLPSIQGEDGAERREGPGSPQEMLTIPHPLLPNITHFLGNRKGRKSFSLELGINHLKMSHFKCVKCDVYQIFPISHLHPHLLAHFMSFP